MTVGEGFPALLELSCLLARPALDDDFGFGEEFNGVASLAMKNAEEAFFPSAEGEISHRGGDADVDADISRGGPVPELASGGTAGGEKRGLVAVEAAAQKIHGFIDGIGVNQTEHRAEDFRIGKLAGGGQAIEDGWREEITGFVAGNFRVAAVKNGFCAFADTGRNERLDALLALLGDDRAHLDAGVQALADANRGSGVRDGVTKSFLRFANRDGNGNREAALARAAEGAVADDLCSQLHIRVGQDDDVVLRAALALNALAAGRSARVHMLSDRRGTNEADRAHLRVVAQRINDGAAAIDEVYDSFREAGLLQEFKRTAHRERHTLGWLQDNGISACDRVWKKPEDDHRRKIEWRDGRDHTEGLANLHFIHAGRHVLEDVALHHHGNAAGDFHVFDAASHLCLGFRAGFFV